MWVGVICFQGCGQRAEITDASPASATRIAPEPKPTQDASPLVLDEQGANPRPLTHIADPIALDPKRFPEAYSPDIAPPAFDLEAYGKDPQAYAAQVIPGRCYQVAQPSPTVDLLCPVGSAGFVCPQGTVIDLRAQTDPGMPVTFTSLGLGVFPLTGLTSQTVIADANGLAVAPFGIDEATVGTVLVIAGSPVRAGTASFLIRVAPTSSVSPQ